MVKQVEQNRTRAVNPMISSAPKITSSILVFNMLSEKHWDVGLDLTGIHTAELYQIPSAASPTSFI